MVGQIRLFCIVLFAAMMPNGIVASTGETEEENKHHGIGLTGELTSGTTWQMEVSYHWFPIQYVGIGASLGLWKQIGGDESPATEEWRISEDSHNITNGYFMPSLLFRTPALIKTEDVKIGLMAEPGCMMNVPYDKVSLEKTYGTGIPIEQEKISYHKGNLLAFNFRVGIYTSFDNITMSLGYVYSDLDIYAMRRNMRYDNIHFSGFYPKRKAVGGLYVKVSLAL